MNTKEFLDLVLPSEGSGKRVIGFLPPGAAKFSHTVHDNNIGAAASVANLVSRGHNVYHALAAYKQGYHPRPNDASKSQLRVHANVAALRSFWMDLDVKPGVDKHYQTREEAVDGIKAFCTHYNLPRPMLVASGRYGVHTYWVMDADMTMAEWKPKADALKALAMKSGLLADHAITADAARVLRPTGSFNMKLGTDPVETLSSPRVYHKEDFFALLQDAAQSNVTLPSVASFDAIPGVAPVAREDMECNTEVARQFDNLPVSLKKIVDQCALLASTYDSNGAGDPEPVWYACAGIASYTDNPEADLDVLSSGHSGYDPSANAARLKRWREKTSGPATCSRLQSAYGNTCDNCPHKGKITTPVQLGRYVNEAKPIKVTSEELGLEDFTIPNPPHPFKRSEDKGIYFISEDGSGASIPMQVCPFDIYPIRLQECERKGEFNVVWRTTLPFSGSREVTLPSRQHLAEVGKLMGELAARGVTVQPKNGKIMQEFMVGYIRALQESTPAATQFARLGWRDDGTFVTPSGICTPAGYVEFPAVQPFVKEIEGLTLQGKYEQAGSLEEWKQCVAFYRDPRYAAHQLGFLLSAGSPLLYFTNVQGLMVNLVGESGSGKTTVGYLSNSLWGHPIKFGMNGGERGATVNATFRMISLRNHIGLVIDEVSNWTGERSGEMVYNISQGVGRMRMNGAESFAQAEGWCMIAESSSNQSLAGKIGSYKADSNAELMRLFEFPCEKVGVHEKAQADAHLRRMRSNYGLAGPMIMQFIVENRVAIEAKMHRVIEMIDREADVQSGERFWSAGIACGLVMGSAMKKLGLLDWDLDQVMAYAIRCIRNSRVTTRVSNAVTGGLFNGLLNAHVADTMVLGSMTMTTIGGMETPLQSPRGKLLIRKELATNSLWIAVSLVRQYCSDNGIDTKTLADELITSGASTPEDLKAKKVLGANTIHANGQVRCWKVDFTKLA